MTRSLTGSVRYNLILVVLASVLPLLIFVFATGWERRAEEVRHAELTAQRLADHYAQVQMAEVIRIRGVLERLSQAPGVQELEPKAATTSLTSFLAANPNYINFVLVDETGMSVASGIKFLRASLAERKEFIDARRTGNFAVGACSIGKVSGIRILPFAQPVRDHNGAVVGYVIATMSLGDLSSMFASTRLPADSFVGLADHAGNRMYRYPDLDLPFGRPISTAVWSRMIAVPERTVFTETSSDGVSRIYAVHRLSLGSGQEPFMYVFVGIPQATVLAEADAVTRRYLIWLGFSLLLSSGFALVVGRYGIHGRVRRLVHVAERLGEGDLTVRSGLTGSGGSLGRLSAALDRMAENLEHDIAKRAHTQEMLEAEVTRRKRLMEMSLDGIVTINAEHAVVECNRRFADMLGYSQEEVIGMYTWDYEAVMSKDEILEGFTHIPEIERKFETMHRRKDGSIFNVEVSGKGGTVFGEDLLLAVVRDITERKRAETLLRESETRYRLLAERAPVSIMAFDATGRITFVNRHHLEHFARGTKVESYFLGRVVTELPGVVRAGISHHLTGLLQGEAVDLEAVYFPMFSGGGSGYVNLRGVPLHNDQGRFMGGILIREDVTRRIELERSLLVSRDEAEAANRAKSEFLANMSHEIRTPLNGIMGMLQLLRGDGLTPAQQEYVSLGMQSGRRLTQLLTDILDISRIEAGKLVIRSERFDIRESLRQVMELFRATSRDSGVKLACEIDPALPAQVLGDAYRLQQILTNLIGNSFKFTSQGEVRLEAWRMPSHRENRVRILFSVLDTGTGISDKDLARLFEPFSQVSQGFTRERQGAGLGLAICKRLAHLMRGTITVESEPGHGTIMHVCLEFEPVEGAGEDAEAGGASAVKAGRNLRVLVADDDALSRLTAGKMLEWHGAEVAYAENGEQALAVFAERDFDLVLMDVQMPVLDGLRTLAAMRDSTRFGDKARTFIAAMTAYAMTGDREKFLAAGMDDYLSKPVDLGAFRELLERAEKAGKK